MTIDYHRGLLVIDSPGPIAEGFHSWSFKGPPRVSLRLNGIVVPAIIDTAIPDNAIVPEYLLDESEGTRARVDIELAGVDFDDIDVATARTGDIRLGNRLLANFVVRIDYVHRTVALWQDSR